MEFPRMTGLRGQVLPKLIAFVLAWVTALAHVPSSSPVNAQSPDSDREATAAPPAGDEEEEGDGEEIAYWVSQLGSDQYLRRRRASRWLVEAGPATVPALVSQLGNGDLEFTRRAIDVLQEVAFAQAPDEDGGAWGELQELAASGVGSQASRAFAAVEEIRDHRGQIAREVLASNGVYVGVAEFVVRASSDMRPIVQVDRMDDGDLDYLQWLRWLKDIRYARIVGEAVDAEVVEYLVRMPDLETITFLDGEVDPSLITALEEIKRIRDLEFRYVSLEPELADQIVQLPIRSSLSLMGTGIPEEKVEQMRAARPGLQIEHRQGGFLGVQCHTEFNICQITGVVRGSAADEAGLIPQDVIVSVGDTDVRRFKDLQDAINQHLPGDEIQIRYSRGGVISETTAELGRMEQEIRGIPDR